jgi:hypothetical protein
MRVQRRIQDAIVDCDIAILISDIGCVCVTAFRKRYR